MKIEHTITPEIADINFLTAKINEETPDFGLSYPFAFFIRNYYGKIIAGCNGSVIFGSIYTDQLWVDPSYRKQGWGRKLMENVHDYGSNIGCTIATVTTMSFQNSCSFYKSLGYESDFKRIGYAKDSSCIFLKKLL